jgi:hypothetical protein
MNTHLFELMRINLNKCVLMQIYLNQLNLNLRLFARLLLEKGVLDAILCRNYAKLYLLERIRQN